MRGSRKAKTLASGGPVVPPWCTMAWPATHLSLPAGFEHGFDVHDWCLIDRLEVSHLDAEILDGKNLDHVHPEWVGPIRGARDEYTLHGSACVAPGMHLANAPIRQV